MENIIHARSGDSETRTVAAHMEVTNISFSDIEHSREDCEIVELYWQRDESAIRETERKYSAYLSKIARNILGNTQDGEESVNDTYLRAWNSMPSHRPENLAAYLGKIVRNLSLNALQKSSRQKRQGSQHAVSLSELEECIPGGSSPEHEVEAKLLADKINDWLKTVSAEVGDMFVGRYFFMHSVKTIAESYNISESKVKVTLHRSRLGLKEYLEQEGFTI
jgi:RNA polymerase sigma-70 factor (ECF subfamily)